MAMQNENVQTEDAGLLALWLFLRLQGVDAAFDQIRERCGTATVGIRAMLRCARQLGIGARSRTTHWKRLVGMRLPGIASLRDGGFLLLGRADDNGALVLYPSARQPQLITRAEFEAIWDGRVVSAGSPGFIQRVGHALAGTFIRGRSLAELVVIRGRSLAARVRHAVVGASIRTRGSAQYARRAETSIRRRSLAEFVLAGGNSLAERVRHAIAGASIRARGSAPEARRADRGEI
jgi:subfamily B ATP-binding cassette protein HlyB/CyaB